MSLTVLSIIGLSACSANNEQLELSGNYHLAEFETSAEPYGTERTVFQLEELMNKSIEVITSENYITENMLNASNQKDPYKNDISKENQEIIGSLISKDKHYQQFTKSSDDETESEAVEYEELYKFGLEANNFQLFTKNYLPLPDDSKKLKGLHAVADPEAIWSGKNGIYTPVTAGAISVLDEENRYVSFSESYASPITVKGGNIQISFANTTHTLETGYGYLYDEMVNIVSHIEEWSMNQSKKKNIDLKQVEKEVFNLYAPPRGIEYEVDGDIASFTVKVSDDKGNVLSYRSLPSSDTGNLNSHMSLSIKDLYTVPTTIPYELSYEFDHEIAVASYGGNKTSIEEVVENLNANDKLTAFDWKISGDNPQNLTIIAESNDDSEYKFVNRLN